MLASISGKSAREVRVQDKTHYAYTQVLDINKLGTVRVVICYDSKDACQETLAAWVLRGIASSRQGSVGADFYRRLESDRTIGAECRQAFKGPTPKPRPAGL